MRQLLYAFIISSVLTACNQSVSTNADNPIVDTISFNKSPDSSTTQENLTKQRISFRHVSEIVADSVYSIWVEKQDSSFSLALHFQYDDTLAVSYSPECWLMYPYKLEGNKIIVYWDTTIDTKYDFDIVKAINRINRNYIGKPFMILELANDTTLKASYPITELIRKINGSTQKRLFFPSKFNAVQEGELYD